MLPFANISASSEGYFAQGMTQEVTSQLSKLSALRVIGSIAVAQFKDPRGQLSALAKELGIGSTSFGTVREQGTRVRVNVQPHRRAVWTGDLVRAIRPGRRRCLRGAERHRGAGRQGAQCQRDARRTGAHRQTPDFVGRGISAVVQARTAPGKTNEDRLRARIDLLNRAVAIDPRFAAAYSEIANAYYFLGAYGDRSALARGVEAGNSALKIDPELASGFRGLALNLNEMGRLREALPAYLKAVTLNPSYGAGLMDFAHGLMTAGRYDEALKYSLRALQLNPNARGGGYHQGAALVQLDDDARSEHFLTAAAARSPSDGRAADSPGVAGLASATAAGGDRPNPRRDGEGAGPHRGLARARRSRLLPVRLMHPTMSPRWFERAPEGLFHTAPYPVKLAHAYHLHRRGASAGARKISNPRDQPQGSG